MLVFVSHTTEDDATVNSIRRTLESLGYDVWLDSGRMAAGDLLDQTVKDAIDKSDRFIAVLIPDTINFRWVRKEIKYAAPKEKRIIPILLPGIKETALDAWFDEEPVVIRFSVDPEGLAAAGTTLMAPWGSLSAPVAG